jgi:hypothetical protein
LENLSLQRKYNVNKNLQSYNSFCMHKFLLENTKQFQGTNTPHHIYTNHYSRRVAAKRWQKKQVIEQVWQQELKINDSNFHSILIASKKANHEALYNAAIAYVARNLKRLKSRKSFQNLQKEPEILISILEQAKSPRSKYVYGI